MAIKAISGLFRWLDDLEEVVTQSADERLKKTCAGVAIEADRMGHYLHDLLKQLGRAEEQADEMGGALQRGVCKLVEMRAKLKELEELKKHYNQLKLAEAGVDPRPIQLPVAQTKKGLSGIKHSSSYEDFKKQRLQQPQQSSGSTGAGSAGGGSVAGFGFRSKARSDPDISRQNLQKDLEAFKVDVQRLRVSEKKLLKENLGLNRKCRILTEERDRAEDRLMIEQTQRDSIERLRQRNKELEEQVQKLRQRQLIKEKEKAAAEKNTE